MIYCPKCKSRLFPVDEEYIREHGVCSYCVTYNVVKVEQHGIDVEPITTREDE